MAETIVISPGEVRAGGNELLAAKADLDAVLATLRTVVAANGTETWGDDSYGRQFADGKTGYRSSRTNLLDGVREFATTIGEFGTGLIGAADRTERTETGNTARF